MSATRRPLVVGNWKMHKTRAETSAFVHELLALAPPVDAVDTVVCPPFTALAAAAEALRGSRIGLGAQNVHWAAAGAFTGEIAPGMLAEIGVGWVVIGHSERRAFFGELDLFVGRKVRAVLDAGMTPVVAVGETAEEHAAGAAVARVTAQAQAAFADIAPEDVARCVVAYEPIWAIGTGNADHPDDADATMGAIRAALPGLRDVRILYGGSVKPGNVAAFCARPNIDGGLVGGASLEAASFAAIIRNARTEVSAP